MQGIIIPAANTHGWISYYYYGNITIAFSLYSIPHDNNR